MVLQKQFGINPKKPKTYRVQAVLYGYTHNVPMGLRSLLQATDKEYRVVFLDKDA